MRTACLIAALWLAGCSGPSTPVTREESSPATSPTNAGSPAPTQQTCDLPVNHVLRAKVDALPVHARSAAWIDSIGRNTPFHVDFSIPVNYVSGVTRYVRFESESGEGDRGYMPDVQKPRLEGGSDTHLLVVDTSTCLLYELFDARAQKDRWMSGAAAIFDLKSYVLRPREYTSADAAGLPIAPLMVSKRELDSGVIQHAIRFTAPKSSREFLWPARHFASNSEDPALPPMGARFRLRKNFDLAGFSPRSRVILQAMKDYGIILADNGSPWYFQGDPEALRTEQELHLVTGEFQKIKGSDFEAIDASSLMADPDSARVK